ncbi:hypothetical protein SBI67_16095 [Mycolicibacterium sp. 120266]|uniref:Rv1733c family protein n=1 Tax=Mycolicibacterium sp. 120266 TaxID=3090601 RepID=UPI00299F1FD1|nr:hypothetical protein [Mycolicibacterium sp. 120266]MDX1873640.1 hypothetical protein [Mycolicibacterium sp. 120266]
MTTRHRPLSAWLRCLVGTHPLSRRSDRIQARVLALAVMMALVAIPMCVSPARAYQAEVLSRSETQLRTLRPVDAVVLPPAASASPSRTPSAARVVRVQWKSAFVERTADVQTRAIARPGDHIRIWLNAHGDPTAAPLSPSDATGQAVAYGIAIWLSITVACAVLYLLMRRMLDRGRLAAWEHEWRRVSDGGWANRDR